MADIENQKENDENKTVELPKVGTHSLKEEASSKPQLTELQKEMVRYNDEQENRGNCHTMWHYAKVGTENFIDTWEFLNPNSKEGGGAVRDISQSTRKNETRKPGMVKQLSGSLTEVFSGEEGDPFAYLNEKPAEKLTTENKKKENNDKEEEGDEEGDEEEGEYEEEEEYEEYEEDEEEEKSVKKEEEENGKKSILEQFVDTYDPQQDAREIEGDPMFNKKLWQTRFIRTVTVISCLLWLWTFTLAIGFLVNGLEAGEDEDDDKYCEGSGVDDLELYLYIFSIVIILFTVVTGIIIGTACMGSSSGNSSSTALRGLIVGGFLILVIFLCIIGNLIMYSNENDHDCDVRAYNAANTLLGQGVFSIFLLLCCLCWFRTLPKEGDDDEWEYVDEDEVEV